MGDRERDSDDEIDEEDLPLSERITKLEKSAEEARAMIKAVNQALWRQGFPVEALGDANSASKPAPKSGIRIGGKLSFRGVEMSDEYFDELDEDGDGLLRLSDVRGMLSFRDPGKLGKAVHAWKFSRFETWRMWLADRGIPNEGGALRKPHFTALRKYLEPTHPLMPELKTSGLGFLPKNQRLWRDIKVRIGEAIAARDPNAKRECEPNYLDLTELSFVLNTCGLHYCEQEIMRAMIPRARLEVVLQQLRRKTFKMDYASDPHLYRAQLMNKGLPPPEDAVAGDISKKDMRMCRPESLLAWAMATRPAPMLPGMHRAVLALKYNTHWYFRRLSAQCARLWDLSLYFREAQVFKDFEGLEGGMATQRRTQPGTSGTGGSRPASRAATSRPGTPGTAVAAAAAEKKRRLWLKQKEKEKVRTTMSFSLKVGEHEVADEGSGFSAKLFRMERCDQFMVSRGLPRDCGLCFCVELLLRSDVDDHAVEQTINDLKVQLMRNLDKELSINPYYRGLYILPATSDGDGAQVIRVAFAFRRLVSLDALLDMAQLPYQATDLVPDLSVECKLNVHMLDLVASSQVATDQRLSFRLDVTTQLQQGCLLKILDRAAMCLRATESRRGIRAAQESAAKVAAAAATRRQQRKDEAEVRDTELARRRALGLPDPPREEEQLRLQHESAQDAVAAAEDERQRYIDKWAHLRPLFPSVLQRVDWMRKWLRGTTLTQTTLKFSSVSEFLHSMESDSPFRKRWLPSSLGSAPGRLPQLFTTWTQKWRQSVGQTFEMCKTYLFGKIRIDEERRQRALRTIAKRPKSAPKEGEGEGEGDGEAGVDGGLGERERASSAIAITGGAGGAADGATGDPSSSDMGIVAVPDKDELAAAAAERAEKEEEAKKAKLDALMGRLNKLGVEADEEDIFAGVEEENLSPEEAVNEEIEFMAKAAISALVTYDRLWNSTLGIHVVELAAGKTRLSVKMHGMDLMELVPEPPAMVKVREEAAKIESLQREKRDKDRKREMGLTDEPPE